MHFSKALSQAGAKVKSWILSVCSASRLETLEICLDIDQLNLWLASKADLQCGDLIFGADAFEDLD